MTPIVSITTRARLVEIYSALLEVTVHDLPRALLLTENTTIRRAPRRALRGLSLIEAMAAGTLLAVGLSATLSGMGLLLGTMREERVALVACNAARNKMEELTVLPKSSPQLTPGNHGPETPSGGNTGAFVSWSVVMGAPVPGAMSLSVRAGQSGATHECVVGTNL